jgi:hypothetical protein
VRFGWWSRSRNYGVENFCENAPLQINASLAGCGHSSEIQEFAVLHRFVLHRTDPSGCRQQTAFSDPPALLVVLQLCALQD